MTLTLNQVLDRMRELGDQGYNVYIKGRGDGRVIPVAEYFEVLTEEKIKKIEKEKRKRAVSRIIQS